MQQLDCSAEGSNVANFVSLKQGVAYKKLSLDK